MVGERWRRVLSPAQAAVPSTPIPLLTVRGDVNFLWKLCHVHLKAVLDVIKDFGIVLIRHKRDGQAFGAKAAGTGHLQRQACVRAEGGWVGHPPREGHSLGGGRYPSPLACHS